MSDVTIDSVWACEGGKQVQLERGPNGRVRVTVFVNYGSVDQVVESVATIEGWRWERLVEAMKAIPPYPATPDTTAVSEGKVKE